MDRLRWRNMCLNTVMFLVVLYLPSKSRSHLITGIDEMIDAYEHLNLVRTIKGGKFKMGINDPRSDSGEYPPYNIAVGSFIIDRFPVTNARFWKFRQKRTRHFTGSEIRGWSWVFRDFVSNETLGKSTPSRDPWWVAVHGATWRKPEGPDSTIKHILDRPVVHVNLNDAATFCHNEGKRLPTEQEWEYAARGGKDGLTFPWGEAYKRNRANIWQGPFPHSNEHRDGWKGLSPVDAFGPQNDYGMHDVLGNVWEWTTTRYYERLIDRRLQEEMYVVKGGSYIDTFDGQYNHAIRTAQRMGLNPEYTAHNVGFRCVLPIPDEKFKEKSLRKMRRTHDEL
ncbi:inactive C-alpha-formylglycine-generating enzyme 2-like [Ylistrum balloti]|uniref:inactive C-alpha-formylglycine-generating enzyme 2-like n=1 Tax=Ylistrum balloti TaxID=509963 RepID=UPI002905F2A8|nr:inactive C-alpha-formylglycine-generating enzyme 2-like [Ylistrum balloti]